ncbi:MAG: DUF748 domain-containing protein [Paraperlucidibaca sp.]|nr:DUF748 domain-containing protein [Paraperlucidibaca sp.]MBQ0841345.1 DUF748 domain-containing protein [Paraperlucidibaca sp.]
MTKPSATPVSATKTISKRSRWLLGGLALLIVVWLGIVTAIEFLAPNWVENTLAKEISQRLGIAIRIERVDTDAFEGKLHIFGVAVDDKEGQPLIGFRELHLDYSWLSLLSPVWVLESATLVQPTIHLRLPAEGPLTLMQLVPSSDGPAVETPRWQLKSLAISEGELSYRDERVKPAREFALSNWGLNLDDIGTESANGLAELHGDLPAGASIDWIGDVGLQPLRSKGRLQINKLSLPDTLGWLPEKLPLAVNNGRISLDLNYDAKLQPDVSVAINNSSATLEDLSLALLKASQKDELASIKTLSAKGVVFAYPSGEWASDKLTLVGANVSVERDANGEFSVIKALAGPPRKAVAKAEPSAPIDWAGSLKQAEISDVMVTYRDLSTRPNTALTLGPLSLSATPKADSAQDSVDITLNTAINTSAKLSLRGELGMPSARANQAPATPYFSGRLSLDDLALKPFEGFISEVLAIRLPSGELSTDGQLQWQTPSAPSWAWSGDTSVKNLRVLEARGQPLLSLNTLQVTGLKAQGTPLQVGINRLLIDSPKLRVSRQSDGSLNVANLTKTSSSNSSANSESNARSDVFINTLAVRGGTVAFADNSLAPSVATALSQLSGSISKIDLTGRQNAQIKLRGYLPNAAPIAIEGAVNIVQPTKAFDMTLRAERLALVPYSAYASRYAGYALADGLLWADLKYSIDKGSLSAKNTLRINDFTWGEASGSKEATGLPVRLGTALLKDVKGEIHLDVPLSGNLSDPEFRVWPIVWQTLGNLITRAAAAPFKLLGGLAGGGDDLNQVSFAANSAALSESAKAQVTTLAASLKDKPELQMSLAGHSDATKDMMPGLSPEAASKHAYDLAKARAVAVQQALIAAGVPAQQLVLEQPKATTDASLAVSLTISLP